MSIATEILRLRRDPSSSVAALLAAMDWKRSAADAAHLLARGYDVLRLADFVLLNVAAHAADALDEPPAFPKSRRAPSPFRGKRRRPNPANSISAVCLLDRGASQDRAPLAALRVQVSIFAARVFRPSKLLSGSPEPSPSPLPETEPWFDGVYFSKRRSPPFCMADLMVPVHTRR